jgi:lipopolysaccharide transport system permease protein
MAWNSSATGLTSRPTNQQADGACSLVAPRPGNADQSTLTDPMSISTLSSDLPVSLTDTIPHVTVIESRPGWRLIDFRELYQYRDLLRFLTWRGIKVLYAQSAIGIGWAILQPLCAMLIFTIVFGRFAGIESGGVPYSIFSLVALVPWTYFSNALLEASNSLVSQKEMISKVYFPRVILPLSGVLAKLVDFCIAMALVVVLMAWYRLVPTWNIVYLPLVVVVMVTSAAGLGMWLTAMAIQYRDVKYGLNFVVQLMMYVSPVVYPTSLVPAKWQSLYALNPMVGVIEGFRAALLGGRPMPWEWIGIGSLTSGVLLVSGLLYFRRQERMFADVA